ncbi:hypothetical protein [Dinghuibacter silviterrae]|uniref:Uncharacterized protein n=1 Tax=Dinghuibacter silviterrae TaxID=1539049 RepID=A0A4R8DTC8_9BACT|nr:hypothetical protein [Dinghuibacter silviterrae]TDX00401.1 hypothetical protein EDB95_1424 [Dinghuibacter silviterrae]
MKKGTFFTYRFLGTFVSLMAYMAFFASVIRLFGVELHPKLMIYLFASGCMVIYSVLSRLFSQIVLKEGKPLRRSLKEWLIANAAVLIAGILYGLARMHSVFLSQPMVDRFSKTIADAHMTSQYPPAVIHTELELSFVFFAVIVSVGIVHAIWTLFLVRRYKDYFQ